MEEQKVASLQIIANFDIMCSTSNQFRLQCQFSLSFCGSVYISISMPAFPSTGERQIGKNFESSGHGTIVVSQNVFEGTY
jgi:hypothetical protein